MKKATVYAKHKYARISPKKVKIVMDLIRGRNVNEAVRILTFDTTKASKMLLKVLNSAIRSAKNNLNLSDDKLFISEIYADAGPMLKRGRIVARSRFSPILKRTSHIVVGLSERKGAFEQSPI